MSSGPAALLLALHPETAARVTHPDLRSRAVRPADRVFRNDVIRLADLTVNTMELDGYEFSNCRVIGPAVLLPVGTTSIFHCGWEAPGVDAIFWEIPPTRVYVVGAIVAVDCTFSGCSFQGVGLAGPSALREAMASGFS